MPVKGSPMRFKRRSSSPLKSKARRGFRGYPVATIALYGPDDKVATKVAVGIVTREDAEPDFLERWFSQTGDVRSDPGIERAILKFIRLHEAKTVIMTDGMLGCPHEEGIDYPDGGFCPQCPFWRNRSRFTGEIIQ